jgi:hypothetical protein
MSLDFAWFLTRLELTIAFGASLVAPVLFIAAPGYMEPMFHRVRTPETLLQGAAILVIWLATALMFAIWRGDPEEDAPVWRYRA